MTIVVLWLSCCYRRVTPDRGFMPIAIIIVLFSIMLSLGNTGEWLPSSPPPFFFSGFEWGELPAGETPARGR